VPPITQCGGGGLAAPTHRRRAIFAPFASLHPPSMHGCELCHHTPPPLCHLAQLSRAREAEIAAARARAAAAAAAATAAAVATPAAEPSPVDTAVTSPSARLGGSDEPPFAAGGGGDGAAEGAGVVTTSVDARAVPRRARSPGRALSPGRSHASVGSPQPPPGITISPKDIDAYLRGQGFPAGEREYLKAGSGAGGGRRGSVGAAALSPGQSAQLEGYGLAGDGTEPADVAVGVDGEPQPRQRRRSIAEVKYAHVSAKVDTRRRSQVEADDAAAAVAAAAEGEGGGATARSGGAGGGGGATGRRSSTGGGAAASPAPPVHTNWQKAGEWGSGREGGGCLGAVFACADGEVQPPCGPCGCATSA
jgi:hypothetical protein